MLWSCCEDHQRSQECLSLVAPAARPGELRALPRAPLPCSLPAPGGQDRRDRDLLPVSLEDAPGRAGCCSWYQGTGPALPCPFLVWGGSHGSSSRLGVLGQVFKKSWWPFELASGTGLPLDWGRVLAYPCLSSREGSRKVLGHAGTAWSSVGAHGAEQVLGASASPSCLSQKPPQQPRLLPGVLCLFQLSLGRKSECAGAGSLCSNVPMDSPVPWGWSWELLGSSSAPSVQLWLPGHGGHGWAAAGG